MKILFLMNGNFSNHSTSEHLLAAVLEQLAIGGNEIHVVQMLNPGDVLSLPEAVAELSVTTEGVPVTPQKKSNFVARYLNAIKNYNHCRAAIKAHSDSEAVFVQSTNVAGVAVGLARKYIKNARITYNVQDILPYNLACSGNLKKNSIVFKVLAAVQRHGYRCADRIITISEDMKDTLVADGTPADKIEVIYNWSYQDEPYDNVDLTPVSDMFSKEYFNVVYAGNIGVMQNVDILIEAAKLMKDDKTVWFHIIGNGVYKEKLEAKAEDYGITNISFWPMQPPELAPAVYSAANVNVIPLVKDAFRTALPSKTATCLACGKPIIFAIGRDSVFGNRLQERTNCVVIESNQPGEVVEAITSIRNEEAIPTFGRYFEEEFSITKNSAIYAQIITKGE